MAEENSIRLFIDEDVWLGLAEALRERGFDAVHVYEVDRGSRQVLLATPPDKAAGLLPYVDSVRTVVRKHNHAFVIEIDKGEMIKELEAE